VDQIGGVVVVVVRLVFVPVLAGGLLVELVKMSV
jgi:hypothetical protein